MILDTGTQPKIALILGTRYSVKNWPRYIPTLHRSVRRPIYAPHNYYRLF